MFCCKVQQTSTASKEIYLFHMLEELDKEPAGLLNNRNMHITPFYDNEEASIKMSIFVRFLLLYRIHQIRYLSPAWKKVVQTLQYQCKNLCEDDEPIYIYLSVYDAYLQLVMSLSLSCHPSPVAGPNPIGFRAQPKTQFQFRSINLVAQKQSLLLLLLNLFGFYCCCQTYYFLLTQSKTHWQRGPRNNLSHRIIIYVLYNLFPFYWWETAIGLQVNPLLSIDWQWQQWTTKKWGLTRLEDLSFN